MQKKFLMTAVAIVSLCLGGTASAAIASWTGDFSTDFMSPYNWDSQAAPTTGDTLTIVLGNYYNAVYDHVGVTSTTGVVTLSRGTGSLAVTAGTLRFNGLTDTSLTIRNTSGVLINGGTLTCGKNIYIGRAGDDAVMTVTSGALKVGHGGVVTVGNASDSAVLNLWGGDNDLGAMPRVAYSSGAGYIDIRSPGTALINDPCSIYLAAVNTMISNNQIVSGPGEEPNAIVVFDPPTDSNFPHVLIRTLPVYYAVSPSPASTATLTHVIAQTGQVLSWVNAAPRIPGETVTSTVLFGTTDPPTTVVASGITGTSTTVNTATEQRYYWRVNSTDTNGGSPITTIGKVWSFDTKIAPTVTVGHNNRQAAYKGATGPTDPNAAVTLIATATDADSAPGAMTYGWVSNDEPNTVWANPAVLTPSVKFATKHDYTLTLTVTDTANTTTATLTVRVFEAGDFCNGAKFPSTFALLAGDIDQDCKVDYKDLATLVLEWLVCNSPDCI